MVACYIKDQMMNDQRIQLLISVRPDSINSTDITLIYQNVSEVDRYEYGDTYGIEKNAGSGWESVEPIQEIASLATIYYVLPGESAVDVIDWSEKYGSLPSGEYRIVKWFESDQTEQSENELVKNVFYVEFSLD